MESIMPSPITTNQTQTITQTHENGETISMAASTPIKTEILKTNESITFSDASLTPTTTTNASATSTGDGSTTKLGSGSKSKSSLQILLIY